MCVAQKRRCLSSLIPLATQANYEINFVFRSFTELDSKLEMQIFACWK